MNDLKTIIQALRPYIRVDYKALLHEALNGTLSNAEDVFGDLELNLLYHLAHAALDHGTVGIDPTWELVRVQSVEYYISSNGNATYKLNSERGLVYVRKDTPQQAELLSLYPDLAKLALKQMADADFSVYASPDGQWLKVEKIVAGGRVTLSDPTERQAAVIRKAFDRYHVDDLVFVDFETTGLSNDKDTPSTMPEICAFAIVQNDDMAIGFVNPQNPQRLLVSDRHGKSAGTVNGITPNILADQPSFPEVYRDFLRPHLQDQIVVTYGDFDVTALNRDIERHGLEPLTFYHVNMIEVYAEYLGESKRGGGYKWQKLVDAYRQVTGKDLVDAHSALADTQALAELTTTLINRHMN